jgi:hypothetical protein
MLRPAARCSVNAVVPPGLFPNRCGWLVFYPFFARWSTVARLGLSLRGRVAVVCTESVQYLFDYFFGVRVFFERTGGARFFGVKIFIGGFSMILP